MKAWFRYIPFIFILLCLIQCNSASRYRSFTGSSLGTTYKVVYKPIENAHWSMESTIRRTVNGAMSAIDRSLSYFNTRSLISDINQNKVHAVDSHFVKIYDIACQVYQETEGAFDITTGVLDDFWTEKDISSANQIPQSDLDNLLTYTGMDKIWISNSTLRKNHPNIQLDLRSLTKGYAADEIAKILRHFNVTDYMIEVGNEIVAAGVNPSEQLWRVSVDRSIQDVIYLKDKALSTAGSYMDYYVSNNEKRPKVYDPRTGKPVTHGLLCCIVICESCTIADAYSTALMVMGMDKGLTFLENHPELSVIFVYEKDGEIQTFATKNVVPRYEIQYIP